MIKVEWDVTCIDLGFLFSELFSQKNGLLAHMHQAHKLATIHEDCFIVEVEQMVVEDFGHPRNGDGGKVRQSGGPPWQLLRDTKTLRLERWSIDWENDNLEIGNSLCSFEWLKHLYQLIASNQEPIPDVSTLTHFRLQIDKHNRPEQLSPLCYSF